jgi:4-hydroxy-tetrahydrodipicolinate synthase
MTFSPNGTYTALVTPFTEDDTFDEAAFRRLIDFQIGAGASGLTVGTATYF